VVGLAVCPSPTRDDHHDLWGRTAHHHRAGRETFSRATVLPSVISISTGASAATATEIARTLAAEAISVHPGEEIGIGI